MTLTDEQAKAMAQVESWLHDERPTFALAGLAGTGKSFLLSEIWKKLPHATVCCPTGKAASVLRRKGIDCAQTIHSAIYFVVGEDREGKPLFDMLEDPDIDGSGLVLLDEASMLAKKIDDDLRSVARKVLYSGDHGQLEPVGEDARVLRDPDVTLETIHRQALDSGVIRFAHAIRQGRNIRVAAADAQPEVEILNRWHELRSLVPKIDVFIVAFNRTRLSINAMVRDELGFKGEWPNAGEIVVCLHNQRRRGIWNGECYTVERVRQDDELTVMVDLMTDTGRLISSLPTIKAQYARARKIPEAELPADLPEGVAFFDFGYALTCHRSQGSEWDSVCVVDELPATCLWDPRRWRYTAATRAAKKLYWKCVR